MPKDVSLRPAIDDPSAPSRRDFLAASALGILSIARLGRGDSIRGDSEMLYVGTYTDEHRAEGIHRARFDTRSGALSILQSVAAGPNPSFLALRPDGQTLYAVNEVADGSVRAFRIAGDTGALTSLGETRASAGRGPCYVSLDRNGHVALVANYESGTVAALPIRPDGSLDRTTSVDQHRGTGPDTERQEGPHAHCIRCDPSNKFALSADLGMDRVLVYRFDAVAGTLQRVESADAVLRPGAGPRHLTFHPRLPLLFVANELDSTVTGCRFDSNSGTVTPAQTLSTLPAGWSGANFPADIHVAPLGNALYVSNRGHNSIAVFSVAEHTGTLALVQTISTEGDWPRNFALDPTGRWLLAANQRSDSIVVLARDSSSGRLSATGRALPVRAPVCLKFRTHP